MSHHGQDRFPGASIPPSKTEDSVAKSLETLAAESLQSQLEALERQIEHDGREALGPTGKFPEGRLVPTDEGEFTYRVGSTAGKVILDFGKPMTWMGFDPKQAEQLWRSLKKHARRALAQQKAAAS